MKGPFIRLICLFCLVVVSASCRTFKPDDAGAAHGLVPERFVNPAGTVQAGDRWWEGFRRDELSGLIEEAFAQNLTLVGAEARLRQAAAQARKAGAALTPELSLSAGAGVTRTGGDERGLPQPDSNSRDRTVEDYSLGVSATYEVDLWGRVRSTRQSATELAAASEADLAAAGVTVSAQVTELWLRILEGRAQLALLAQQLETNETQLDLLELRQRKGRSTALDVYQQKQIIAGIQSQVPAFEAVVERALNQLAVLLGRTPGSGPKVAGRDLPGAPDVPDAGIPVDVLARRPDVQAAWRRLQAAGWDVASSKADRLPAVRLTGGARYNSDEMSTLFDNWLLNLAGNLTAPILDGSRRRAEVARVEALHDERLARYRLAVLSAVREVEDALLTERKQKQVLVALEDELSFAQRALQEARTRYRKGQNDYLRVLLATASVQGLERQVLQARREALSARVSLYRALAGDFDEEQPNEDD